MLVPGPPGSWDMSVLLPSRVLLVNSVFKMWYTGYRGNELGMIGYATGATEVSMTKYPANPVLGSGPTGSWMTRWRNCVKAGSTSTCSAADAS